MNEWNELKSWEKVKVQRRLEVDKKETRVYDWRGFVNKEEGRARILDKVRI